MAKSSSRHCAKNGTKVSARNTNKRSSGGSATNRPKPMTTKAGYTHNRRRYDEGGEWCW